MRRALFNDAVRELSGIGLKLLLDVILSTSRPYSSPSAPNGQIGLNA